MSLRSEIMSYIDGNGLVSPQLTTDGVKRGSDNGVLHTSRYLLVLKTIGEPFDEQSLTSIKKCIDSDGYIYRSPGDVTQDTPDDYYGLLSLLASCHDTTKIKLPWLCMQPALLYMRGLQTKNILTRLFSFPIAALIFFSNREDDGDTGSRLLTWNLIKGTYSSTLCRIAANYWLKNQKEIYGESPVNKIVNIYYSQNEAFKKYWLI